MTTRKRTPGGVPAQTLTANIISGATSMQIVDGTGWPSTFPYDVIVNRASATSRERITVGGSSGTTPMTLNSLSRGIDGTSGQAHNLGDTVEVCVAGSYLDELGQLLGGSAGDLYYYDGTALQKLAKGTAAQVLGQGASAPAWSWQPLAKFATTGARTTANPAPADGDASYLNAGDATEGPEFYNGSNWRKPWNLPWGIVATASVTANQTGISAEANLTSLTVTFTAVTGRRYKTTGYCKVIQQTSGGSPSVFITDGSNVHSTEWIIAQETGFQATANPIAVETISAGSVTRKLRASTTASTMDMNASATAPAFILVEDIGPSGNPT